MAINFSTLLWVVVGATLLISVAKLLQVGSRPKDYPPGPPTTPILGNLLKLPAENLHLKLQEWAQEFGPIYTLKLGGQTQIVVSSHGIIKDLLEKRSSNTSARMDMLLRQNSDDTNVLFRSNDDGWRRQRKMYHLRLNAKGSDNYVPYQEFESQMLLYDMLHQPESFLENAHRYTASIASTLSYGWRTPKIQIPAVQSMFTWTDCNARIASTLQITDWYPPLRIIFKLIPESMSSLKKEMAYLRNLEETLFIDLFQAAKARIKTGRVRPSFSYDMLMANEKAGDSSLDDKEMAHNAVQACMGATDTQYNTMKGFIKAMILFKDVQKKAQAEIDRVVGTNRLPTWSDRDNMPYIRGVLEESLRWFPTTLLGAMPHAVVKDDAYMGYKIPAGAGIINNVWTVNNDPEMFPNPRQFDPLRHRAEDSMNEFYGISAETSKRPHMTFGAGRRVCPGSHVAQRGLFIAIAQLLWAFDFDFAKDEKGCDVPIDRDAIAFGLMASPAPYTCSIRPRDEKRRALIEKSWSDAQKWLDNDGDFTDEYFETVFAAK